MRAYTHRGLGTPTASQHNIFDSDKPSQLFLVLLTQAEFEPPVFGSWIQRSTNWATLYLYSVFCTLRCPNGNFSHGKFASLFPQGKPAATESRYPTLVNKKVIEWTLPSTMWQQKLERAGLFSFMQLFVRVEPLFVEYCTKKRSTYDNISD